MKHPFIFGLILGLLVLIPFLASYRARLGVVSQKIAQTPGCDAQTIACDPQFQENKNAACGAFKSVAVDNLLSRDESPCKGRDRKFVEAVLNEACVAKCERESPTPTNVNQPTVTETPIITSSPTPTPSPSPTPPATPTLTPTPSPSPTPKPIRGDIDQNNVLDVYDFNLLIECYAEKECPNKKKADLNDDGVVNGKDLNILLRSFAERLLD